MLKCILWKKLQFCWPGCNSPICCKGFRQIQTTEDLATKHDKALEQQWFLPRNQRPANSAHDIWNECSFYNIMLEKGRLTSARSIAHTLLPIANGCKANSILTYCVQASLPKQLKSWISQTPTYYLVSGIDVAAWSRSQEMPQNSTPAKIEWLSVISQIQPGNNFWTSWGGTRLFKSFSTSYWTCLYLDKRLDMELLTSGGAAP
jgi:hypothetical protein